MDLSIPNPFEPPLPPRVFDGRFDILFQPASEKDCFISFYAETTACFIKEKGKSVRKACGREIFWSFWLKREKKNTSKDSKST